MSQFADYEGASKNYDNGRRAAGVDVIAGLIQIMLKKDLKVFVFFTIKPFKKTNCISSN
jgi:hypothetical protein